jgi:hypothetical protein
VLTAIPPDNSWFTIFDGNDTTAEMQLLAFYKPEDVITIFVDREEEKKSCLVPRELA